MSSGIQQEGVHQSVLTQYLQRLLCDTPYPDYCPNGLQVEGTSIIHTLVTGVTASADLIEAALVKKADAILVHHGYFWRNEDPCIVGMKYRRLKLLLDHDVNLYAYHLPLDRHTTLGNNAQLAQRLGLVVDSYFGEQGLGWLGHMKESRALTLGMLAQQVEQTLGKVPMVIGDLSRPLTTIGWCTGAAQGFFSDAIAAGATAYLSGEISEPTVHLARESGVAYLACGHHATERYGVQAVGAHLAQKFGVQHYFIDIDNPV